MSEIEPGIAAEKKPLWIGLVATLGMHIVFQGMFCLLTRQIGYMSVFAIGITQLVYMVPAILIARHGGERQVMKGLIIGAGITVLINGLCAAVVLPGLGRMR